MKKNVRKNEIPIEKQDFQSIVCLGGFLSPTTLFSGVLKYTHIHTLSQRLESVGMRAISK